MLFTANTSWDIILKATDNLYSCNKQTLKGYQQEPSCH